MCTGCPYEPKNETEPILTVKHGELVWLLGEGENSDEGRSADYKDLSIVDWSEGFGIDILQLGQYSRLLYHVKE